MAEAELRPSGTVIPHEVAQITKAQPRTIAKRVSKTGKTEDGLGSLGSLVMTTSKTDHIILRVYKNCKYWSSYPRFLIINSIY